MPAQYEAIKRSLAKDSDASTKEIKSRAAAIFIAKGKGGDRSSRAKSLHSDSDKHRGVAKKAMELFQKSHKK